MTDAVTGYDLKALHEAAAKAVADRVAASKAKLDAALAAFNAEADAREKATTDLLAHALGNDQPAPEPASSTN